MKRISVQRLVRVGCVAACCASSAMAFGSVYRGQVMYGGQPVPGATVTATQGAKTVVVTSDATGGLCVSGPGGWGLDDQGGDALLCDKRAGGDGRGRDAGRVAGS